MYYTYAIPSTFEYVLPPSLGQTHIGISILVGCERNCSLIAQLHTAFVVLCKVLRKKFAPLLSACIPLQAPNTKSYINKF